MAKRGSLVYQIQKNLESKLAIGESKYDAKHQRTADGRRLSDLKIYSYDTFRTYQKHCNYFASWAKETYGCKTLDDARHHVDDWLQHRIDQGLSAYTIKMEAAALAKLYGCSTKAFIRTPERVRSDITRSRGEKGMDKHYSETKNAELTNFGRCTGLRRGELSTVRGSQLIDHGNGSYSIAVIGKGGRYREAPIVGDPEAVRAVVARMEASGDDKVWTKVHAAADVHSWRADYATAIYKACARDVATLDRSERYDCRGDMAGQSYDRAALLEASIALGHNRVSVVAEHYLR